MIQLYKRICCEMMAKEKYLDKAKLILKQLHLLFLMSLFHGNQINSFNLSENINCFFVKIFYTNYFYSMILYLMFKL